MKLKKGDTVKVISGKDRGKTGKILKIFPVQDRVIVEGVNIVKRHAKRTNDQKDPGGIIQKEAPIHVSNVMILLADGKTTSRIGIKRNKAGKKIRILKKDNSEI